MDIMKEDLTKIRDVGIPNIKLLIELMKEIQKFNPQSKTYEEYVFERKQKELKENKHNFF